MFLISLFATIPIASATNQPYNITTTSKYVKATAKCSCGDGTWTYKTVTFYNYDPSSHRWGVLSYSKYADAGQWTSKVTDVDYCMQCGKEKISGSNLHLTRYYGNITESEPVKNATVENKTVSKPKSPIDKAKSTFLSKAHLDIFGLF